MSVEGKVTLITGASRGIGRALAVGFAEQGALVVATARTERPGSGEAEGSLEETVRAISENGGKAWGMACDVSDESQVEAVVGRAVKEVGPIDVLINNAGISTPGSIGEVVVKEWDRVMAVNVRGVLLMCKYVMPDMMERRTGSVINITSRAAIWDSSQSLAYGPSKAALDRFTLNLALDMKPHNIAVNALGPGLIASAMTTNWDPSKDRWGRMPDPPEEVVSAALWLAQQDASSFTGRVVHRDEFGTKWP